MSRVDVVVIITYDIKDPQKTVLYTNARTDNDAISEILSTWIQDQIGRGSDTSKPAERDLYTVEIGLILDGDVFTTSSDAGNLGLTAGIVTDTLGRLNTLTVKPISDRSSP